VRASGSLKHKIWGTDMRLFISCALMISTAIGVAGCWWHHQAAVVTQPEVYTPPPPLK